MENNELNYSIMSQYAREAIFVADFAVFYESRTNISNETKIRQIRKYINTVRIPVSNPKPAVTATTAKKAPAVKSKPAAKRGRKPGSKLVEAK